MAKEADDKIKNTTDSELSPAGLILKYNRADAVQFVQDRDLYLTLKAKYNF